jgi:hypothetical protein
MGWLLVLQLAFFQSVLPPVLHQGHWQSCDHEERVLDHAVLGRVLWSLHLGPDDEFALYKAPEPAEDDHRSPRNLLGPAYAYHALPSRLGRSWRVPSLHLWVNVLQGGGSREECAANSYYIRVETVK